MCVGPMMRYQPVHGSWDQGFYFFYLLHFICSVCLCHPRLMSMAHLQAECKPADINLFNTIQGAWWHTKVNLVPAASAWLRAFWFIWFDSSLLWQNTMSRTAFLHSVDLILALDKSFLNQVRSFSSSCEIPVVLNRAGSEALDVIFHPSTANTEINRL